MRVDGPGVEPGVPAYQTGAFPRSRAVVRSRREGSNLRPPPTQSGAHPLSYDESWSLEESNLDPVGASHVCWPLTPRPQMRATAGTRTRAAALATPRATADTTVARTRTEGIEPSSAGLEPASTPRHVRMKLLERDSNRAPSGSEPEILPLDDRGTKLRRLGSNQHHPGNNRASCRLNDTAMSPPAWIRTTNLPGLSRTPLPGWATRG